MLSDSVSRKKIKPAVFDSDSLEGKSAIKLLAFLTFYLYFLIVLAVYDFTVIGLISALVIPVGLYFLLTILTYTYKATFSQCAFFFYVITIFFLFLKNIIPIVNGIVYMFKSGDIIFSLKILSAIILIVGIIFLFFKSLRSTVIGLLLSGFAIAICLFNSRSGFFISTNGLRFLTVYAVFQLTYCILLKLSENAYSRSGVKDNKISINVKKHKTITNFIMLVLSVVFALYYCAKPDLLRWANVLRFMDVLFSLAIMIPVIVAFCIYYSIANYSISINLLDSSSAKRISAELNYMKIYFMLYVLCGVLYRHYFTFNALLLLAFFILLAKKKNINLVFANLVLLDVLVSIGRTETAIVIGVFEFLILRLYNNTKFSLTRRDKELKPIYVPSESEVINNIISRKSSWILAVVAVTTVMASLLLHVKTPGATRASFIGFIGAPDWKAVLIMVSCALLSILANNLLLHKAQEYKRHCVFSAIILILLFVSCLVVVKKDTTFFRIDPNEESIVVSYNEDGADIESIAFYRGSNIPFTTSKYSNYIGAGDPEHGSFTVYYPNAGSVFCERLEFLIEDENGSYTTYDAYYPLTLYSFFA